MTPKRLSLRHALFLTTALGSLINVAHAQSVAPDNSGGGSGDQTETVIVTAEKTVRSSLVLSGDETQKLLPGINPLKAIETLPGVVFATADPWGNNEQNESLVVHGFTLQQLGFTMDGVPLGDQQYGNYNGLSPSRALTSENVSRVEFQSGAGALGVASTSNLGGAIETFSLDPEQTAGAVVNQTIGSDYTTRTFLRLESGDLGDGNAGYLSFLHQDQRAWDFDGHQRGNQVNLKFVHSDAHGKLTGYFDWQDKDEPNEDSTNFGNANSPATNTYYPYTRTFAFPDLTRYSAYLNTTSIPGTPPTAYGANFSNYYSAAQRLDLLGYVNYDWFLTSDMTWSNQVYYHYNQGRGIVAAPFNQAGLPTLFAVYFPNLVVPGNTPATDANIDAEFGGLGLQVRTTEYLINRGGERSTFTWQFGDHAIEAGIWYEHNESSTGRDWYPFSAANTDLTPYEHPGDPAFVQYYYRFKTDDLQLHAQDEWRILPSLRLQFGVKSSLQNAGDKLPVQQKNNPATPLNQQTNYPIGSIVSDAWFLPQVGAVWDFTDQDQLFANMQKNMRQIVPYGPESGYYATSPWSLGTQQAFDDFKATGHPETSWTYEAGVRSTREVDLGWLTAIEGQVNGYLVNFQHRLLNVAPYNPGFNPPPAIIANVGSVTTYGADVAGTLHFGEHFQFYDAVSYNRSTYNDNYYTGSTLVPTAGKVVPLTPDWLEKFILSTNFGPFEAQINGDYIGQRYVTYTNDLHVNPTFQMGLETSYLLEIPDGYYVHQLKFSLNMTNIGDTKGVETPVVTGASGGYAEYPIAPRMWFFTVSSKF
ncbi:MAG TPA: TonB-dependent receptor [Rhizomicrobium sp.]|nr:TonB-dependent receptor [Rhizomicrobium sp.]